MGTGRIFLIIASSLYGPIREPHQTINRTNNNNYSGDNPEVKYYFAHKEDNNNYIKYLFFAYLELIKFFQKNPNDLLLNYTYKINKFKIAFLYIVGVSNTKQNFKFAYCFLLGNMEVDYSFII